MVPYFKGQNVFDCIDGSLPKLSSIFKSSPSNIDISPSPNIAYLNGYNKIISF
jgi:hypothetical protein